MVLTTGRTYTEAQIKALVLTGWTEGDGSGHEGYCVEHYFSAGRYLGADEHGIEPAFDRGSCGVNLPGSIRTTHLLVRTGFHGGGVVSTHRSVAAAERAQRRYQSTQCECGCAVVVPVEEYDALRASSDSGPYAPARRGTLAYLISTGRVL